MARIDPHNRTGTGGVDLLSNNFNWSLPLVGLKGRGLDLGLSLSYNSLVWTRSSNYMSFDLDDSTVSPGFRLDFPIIEGPFWNDQAGTNFYLMVTPSGGRVEMRYVGIVNTYATYESQDSAHLQLQITDSTHALMRPTDGTRMSFTLGSYGWRCNEIKDRNGNFLTITHNNAGDLSSVKDTLNRTIYDLMARPSQYTNPTEVTAAWVPTGDDSAGWGFSVPNTYDWKSRPLRTYNQDGTYREASYGGCGCAGGEVVTLTDEVGRQQKFYADSLGRTYKVEVLNDGGSVYSTTTSTFNARDQVTAVNTYKGAAPSDLSCPSGTCMQSVTSYDGYGRVATHKLPQQSAPTTYTYNPDDTVYTVTDPRGVAATNNYNGRHLLTGVSYNVPAGVPALSPVSFGYDAVGNRTAMADGTGTISYSYNQLSRLMSETRTFAGVNNSFTISYNYNLGGELTSIIDPSGAQVSYNYDSSGKLMSMPASGYTGVTNFLSNVQYRAFGGLKHATYGNSAQVDLTYNSRIQIGQYQVSG